jgi:hypothetical protein
MKLVTDTTNKLAHVVSYLMGREAELHARLGQPVAVFDSQSYDFLAIWILLSAAGLNRRSGDCPDRCRYRGCCLSPVALKLEPVNDCSRQRRAKILRDA